jgi:membrane-associated protease RseP (regulator of RpoE activity)
MDRPASTASRRTAIAVPALLFTATLLSVFWTGARLSGVNPRSLHELLLGWTYAVPLMAILLCHEFGHYIAARIHGVPASLPYFLPLPELSPFGTLGAVITMPDRIRSRNALLDIGAAGPIGGMLIALPVLVIGLSLSSVQQHATGGYIQEGQSILYALLKRAVLGEIPPGHDVYLHPTAFAGWVGLFITMINLIPWGQLDGGHIAFALFGPAQDRAAPLVLGAVLGMFVFNLFRFVAPVLAGSSSLPLEAAIGNSLFWLVWFIFLFVMRRLTGRTHPPFEPGLLSPRRRTVAGACLGLFVLLCMPTPLSVYPPPEPQATNPAPAPMPAEPWRPKPALGAP